MNYKFIPVETNVEESCLYYKISVGGIYRFTPTTKILESPKLYRDLYHKQFISMVVKYNSKCGVLIFPGGKEITMHIEYGDYIFKQFYTVEKLVWG